MSDEPSTLSLVVKRQDEQQTQLNEQAKDLAEQRKAAEVMTAKFEFMTEAYGKTTIAMRSGIVAILLSAAGIIYFGHP